MDDSFSNDNRRRHGRLRCRDLKAMPFGDVTDISASGLCLCWPRKVKVDLGATMEITLTDDSVTVAVVCRVVRIERWGLFKQMLGVEFVDVDAEQRLRLNELARNMAIQGVTPTDRAGPLITTRTHPAAR